jgi:pimeloyl-ACP methyl ester carboxylesterase
MVVPVPDAWQQVEPQQGREAEDRQRLALGICVDGVGPDVAGVLEQALDDVDRLWAVEHLFGKNEMFKGELEVAGNTVSLRSITCPVFLLGGDEDDVTPWQQVHNMRYVVGSVLVRWYLAPGGHIGLFIGRQSQAEYWTPILAQVRELSRPGVSQAQSPALQPEVAAVHHG